MRKTTRTNPFKKYVDPGKSNSKPFWRNLSKKLIIEEFGDRYSELVALIALYDPFLLYSFSGDAMEYDLEVNTIILQLDQCTTQEEVHALVCRELVRWFGKGAIVEYLNATAIKKMAYDIYDWKQKNGSRNICRELIQEANRLANTGDPDNMHRAIHRCSLACFLYEDEKIKAKIAGLRSIAGD